MEALNEIAQLMGCTTWNDGAKLALSRLDSHSKMHPPSMPYEVEVHKLIKLVNDEESNTFDYYGESLLNIGCSAWLGLAEVDKMDMASLLVNRQLKYGPKNIMAFEYKGIAVRMADKVARIENGEEDFADEAYNDAVMDLVGYCVIAMMLHDGTFHLPVQTTLPGFDLAQSPKVTVSDSARPDLFWRGETYSRLQEIREQFQ